AAPGSRRAAPGRAARRGRRRRPRAVLRRGSRHTFAWQVGFTHERELAAVRADAERAVHRPGEHELQVTDAAGEERRLAVGEVELPHPHEPLVEPEGQDLVDVAEEGLAPAP